MITIFIQLQSTLNPSPVPLGHLDSCDIGENCDNSDNSERSDSSDIRQEEICLQGIVTVCIQ